MTPLDVLLVDDDPFLRSAVARTLQRYHLVRTAGSIAGALAEIQQRVPDVVVSDFDLVHEVGTDLLGQLSETHPTVRRILYSGSNCRDFVELGIAHAAIVKPAETRTLLAAIRGDGGEPSEPQSALAGLPALERSVVSSTEGTQGK